MPLSGRFDRCELELGKQQKHTGYRKNENEEMISKAK